jgi:hypothetical protein
LIDIHQMQPIVHYKSTLLYQHQYTFHNVITMSHHQIEYYQINEFFLSKFLILIVYQILLENLYINVYLNDRDVIKQDQLNQDEMLQQ